MPNDLGFLLNYNELKEDFPLLKKTGIVYLDNAATTQKPRQVINAINRFYIELNANIARGLYELSLKATKLYEEAHEKVAKFIGSEPGEVVFTKNTTDSINIVAWMFIANKLVSRENSIVVTISEHHSNLLPWKTIADIVGCKLRIAPVDKNGFIDIEIMKELIDETTVVAAVGLASNVTGRIQNVREVAKVVHQYGGYIVVDGAQAVPHIPINVKELDIDFLAFSGHKMLGPTGIGVLWAKQDIVENLKYPVQGGGAIKSVRVEEGNIIVDYADMPWRGEPGTPHIAGAIGLAEAIEYLNKIGLENIKKHEETLTRYILKRLSEINSLEGVVGGFSAENRLGIVSFTTKKYTPYALATKLGLEGIAVRAGFHCAEPLHRYLGFNEGSVRVSFYLYNGPEDVDKLIQAIEEE